MCLHVNVRVVRQPRLLTLWGPQADVIFVRHRLRAAEPDNVVKVLTRLSYQFHAVLRAVVDYGASKLALVAVLRVLHHERHRLRGFEIAHDGDEVDAVEGLVVVQSLLSPGVHQEVTLGGLLQEDPSLATHQRAGHCEEQSPVARAVHHDIRERVELVAVHHNRVAPGGGCEPRRVHLRRHPAGPERGSGAPTHVHVEVIDVFHQGNELGLRVAVGVAGVQAVDIGEEEEVVGIAEGGDVRGECVVVAEFEILHGDGVVLVDDGDDIAREERLEGALRVEVLRAVHQVVEAHQHLRDGLAHRGEEVVVHAHEADHADGSHGLFARQVRWFGLLEEESGNEGGSALI